MTEKVLAAADVPLFVAALLRLQHAAYAVEAALIGDDRIPALHEDEDALIDAQLDWLVELDGPTVVGALGFRIVDGVVDLDRLIVDPGHHRRGIGERLVNRLLPLAHTVQVSTGRDNIPARTLYARHGFVHLRDREVLPGLWISDFSLTR